MEVSRPRYDPIQSTSFPVHQKPPSQSQFCILAGYQQAKYAVAYSSGLSKPITNKELVAIGIRGETRSHILVDVLTKNIAD